MKRDKYNVTIIISDGRPDHEAGVHITATLVGVPRDSIINSDEHMLPLIRSVLAQFEQTVTGDEGEPCCAPPWAPSSL